jgi:tRNA (guanine-N7-)-methyltransferase
MIQFPTYQSLSPSYLNQDTNQDLTPLAAEPDLDELDQESATAIVTDAKGVIPWFRLREHVNPLSQRFQAVTPAPNWSEVYADWSQPLSLDIGCARGRYILQMAQMNPQWNFLGLEIRESLVAQALVGKQNLNLTNLHYIFCNANTSLATLLPNNSVQEVTIQFPDPWFKQRHRKRRTVNQELVNTLAQLMVSGGRVLLQTDIQPLMQDMLKHFGACDAFENLAGAGMLASDDLYPVHLATERESWVLHQGLPVYRAYLVRR